MHVRCTECSARFRVDDKHGGRWGRCSQCEARFILPIPDANRLLEWASTTHWSKLLRFVRKGGARGHSPETIKKFIRIYEVRKWAEEDRVRPEGGWRQTRAASSPGQSNLDAPENPALAHDSLDELRRLDPYKFERFVADLFDAMGYDATAVGGTADRGIDVEIRRQDGSKWGVAQCKRYDAQNKIRTDQVLGFGGAYMLSGAERGFFLTTGVFTTHAKKTANGYPWLTTFNGAQLVNYIESINRRIEEAAQTISG